MQSLIKLCFAAVLLVSLFACVQDSSDTVTSTGEGGSTSRFVIQQNHLITIEETFIQVFSLENPLNPDLTNAYYVNERGLILETIYPYQTNKLLLGTTQGAFIIDHSTPGTLVTKSFARHTTNCDPVIAHGNYMYVTLRNGRSCDIIQNVNGVNRLLIYDITNAGELDEDNILIEPQLVKTIDMDQPWGLGIKDSLLFVCVEDGVVEFDISTPEDPQEVGNYSAQCNDIIAGTEPMILTGDDGIRLMTKQGAGLTELAIIREGD